MNENISNWLNISRWSAALLVVISHVRYLILVNYQEVTHKTIWVKGLYLMTGLGHEAVVIFFVVSGFLVGGLTFDRWRTRGPAMREYVVARFSRIYVVLVPALIAGIALDTIGLHWFNDSQLYTNSAQYHTNSLNRVISTGMDFQTFFGNLLMMQGVTTGTLGSNGPLWSLSYEWWYYCIFAFSAVTLTGKSKSVRVGCLLISLALLFLLPIQLIILGTIWLLGIVAFAWVKIGKFNPSPMFGIGSLFLALALSRISHNVDNVENPEAFATSFARDLMLGTAYALALVSTNRISKSLPLARVNSWLADFSYTIYLFHFPALLFIVAVLFSVFGLGFQLQPNAISLTYTFGVIIAIYTYCYVISLITERRTNYVRGRLNSMLSN